MRQKIWLINVPQNALAQITSSFIQCDALIASAHQQDANGAYLFTSISRQQITHAAFLNMFIAWENFLEEVISAYMTGSTTINGSQPVRMVAPASRDEAKKMTVGVMKYFDFSNHEYVKQISNIYFQNGYPVRGAINNINSQLSDLKTMRNACAHVSSTTQRALDSLALRIFGSPAPGISVYTIITSVHPAHNPDTVYLVYRNALLAAATQIANG
ncbi:hypothetical protein FF100_29340 [Methylobacterium terricola]|uniref:RiboL-PSP-HEPN domain-containing protein n=1 Tax=Methylobacterium terricola TaxID=2583531 RepID=A0A5C4LAZ3_9HYPH|nr:hypothetical protein [Methylobacterium terricola]TNC08445.1 hypothetical protein FF100_29340 [Methylobacterium terricola]